MHGWLIRRPDAPSPAPLLLDIHGGPHNAWNGAADDWHLYHQELAARGCTVLLLNPRGSDGYGSDFYDAAIGAWGEADAKDFLEPLDQLVAEGVADPKRLAVTGYSYGGYMTCYLTSRDDRFAAAVAGGVVSDLVSMSGTSDSGHHLSELELGALWWDARDRYDAMSPLDRVEQVRTPTLDLPRRRRRPLPRRPGAAVARRAPRARRPEPARALSRRLTSLRARRTAVAPDRSRPPRRRLGRAVRRRRARRRSTPRTGSSASPSWPSGTACRARRSGSCACARAATTTSSRRRPAC